jgi:hypothetical protein
MSLAEEFSELGYVSLTPELLRRQQRKGEHDNVL